MKAEEYGLLSEKEKVLADLLLGISAQLRRLADLLEREMGE